jgi:hypothetical protein
MTKVIFFMRYSDNKSKKTNQSQYRLFDIYEFINFPNYGTFYYNAVIGRSERLSPEL